MGFLCGHSSDSSAGISYLYKAVTCTRSFYAASFVQRDMTIPSDIERVRELPAEAAKHKY
jgi:hypothetical protein